MTGHFDPWTPEENAQLRQLFEVERKSKPEIAKIMRGRTFAAIAKRTLALGLEYQGRTDKWTAEQDALLRQLRAKGLPYSQIAKRMPGYSRSAIIGRAKRLGLSGGSRAESTRAQQNIKPRVERKSPVRQGMIRFGGGSIPKSVIPERPLARSFSFEKIGHEIGPERPVANPVTLEDRRADQCGWPVNEGGPYLYCGAERGGHRRYCDRHAGVGVGRGRTA